METVVEEKPLSFATSRIVTIVVFKFNSQKRRLKSSGGLADTTAESEGSVKFRRCEPWSLLP
jgi:hypothetical protein